MNNFGRSKKSLSRFSSSRVPRPRRSRVEPLEARELLAANAFDLGMFERNDGAETLEKAALESTENVDRYDIEFVVLESGGAKLLGQNAAQYSSSLTYCAVSDPIYIELLERAISRWEETIAVGLPDVLYEDEIEIDDMLLYFGFSDSYGSTSSLGSSIDGGFRRDGGLGIAAAGSLVFNAEYFTANPDATLQRTFYNTVLHEIGHSLGYNLATFQKLGLVVSSSETPFGLTDVFTTRSNWYYVGEKGVAQFENAYPDALIELGTTDGILMETYAATGSFGTHFSSIFGTYYFNLKQRDGMTYSINPSYDGTITATTLGILEDLGYSIDYDFADPCGSPAPEGLTATVAGTSVRLDWAASAGATATTAFTVERLDVGTPESAWTPIASDVSATSFVDSSVVVGGDYRYRVVANGVSAAIEIGIFKAKAGERITWESDAKSFRVVALVGSDSNAVSWSTIGSTKSKYWDAAQLSSSPYSGTTIYRVFETSSVIATSAPSRAVGVSIAPDADEFVPDGYSSNDWNALKAFLQTTDAQGVRNGTKVDAQYGDGWLDVVSGVVWKNVDGEFRVASISWANRGLVGALELGGCSALESLDVAKNELTSITVDSAKLSVLNVSKNELTQLNVANVVALESLNCAQNRLTALDVSKNVALIYFDASENSIENFDFSKNAILTTLRCAGNLATTLDLSANVYLTSIRAWNESLSEVLLTQEFAGIVDMSDAPDAANVVWLRGDETLGVGASWRFDAFSVAANVGATRIEWRVGTDLAPTTPTDFQFFEYDPTTRTLGTRWTEITDVERFTVQYFVGENAPTSESDWRSVATTTEPTRFARQVAPTSRYWFRVRAVDVVFGKTVVSEWSDAYSFCAATDTTTGVEIVGSLEVGANATAVLTPTNGAATFQWFRVDAEGNETSIADANDATYSPTQDDLGLALKVVATPTSATYFSNPTFVSAISQDVVGERENEKRPNAPIDLTFGKYANNFLETSWVDVATDETGYEVYYRVDGGVWKFAADLKSSTEVSASTGAVVSRVARGVYSNRVYSFRIQAYSTAADGSKIYSESLEGTFDPAFDTPIAVALEGAPLVDSPFNAVVSNASVSTTFEWFRVDAAGNATLIDGANEATYSPTSVDVGFYLKVVVLSREKSADATSKSVVVASGDVPNAPTNFSFGEYANNRLETSWIDAATNETGYEVYYRVGDGAWKIATTILSSADVASSQNNVVSRTATGVYENRIYSFKVCAFVVDANGNRIYSDALEATFDSATTPAVELAPPDDFEATNYSLENRTLQLSWTAVENATGYEVEYRRSSDGGATWNVDWRLAQRLTTTSRTATSVYSNYRYEFRVRAVSVDGRSDWKSVGFQYDPTSSLDAAFAAFGENGLEDALF